MSAAPPRVPPAIAALLEGYRAEKDTVGMSFAAVYRYTGPAGALYLKTEPAGGELPAERRALEWLAGRLPVPAVLAWRQEPDRDWLLLTEMPGRTLPDGEEISDAGERAALVRTLAQGLKQLWALPTAGCPIDNRLERKLAAAGENIRQGRVDMDNSEPDTWRRFGGPQGLLEHLRRHRPPEVRLVFTHGDYTPANLMAEAARVTGFIDLGRAGLADPWQDIALAVRSLEFGAEAGRYTAMLLQELSVAMDAERLEYYILLDELF